MGATVTPRTRRGPDFLCIGTVKSGTTWLHEQLARHPGVWLPPVKELRYFDQPAWDPIGRLVGRDRKRYEYWRHRLRETARHPRLVLRHRGWHLRYFLLPRGDHWYASLFRPAGDRVAGDVTPLYAALPPARVRAAAAAFPQLKAVYLLRDPIERTWSHVVMRCLGLPEVAWDPARITPELVERIFFARDLDDDWLWSVNRYAEHLTVWRAALGAERVLVGFYDDVVARPAHLLRRILDFLEVPGDLPPGDLGAARNVAPATIPLPATVEAVIARRCLDDLERLARLVPELPPTWLQRARRAAAGVG